MSLLQSDVTSTIPLSCNVCTRRPDFSDVSHLLTHIQSKGHLSAYYKLKVKASSDQDAQDTIDAYDEWYADWGLEDLMRERMNQKDKKKAAGGNAPRRSTNSTNSSRSTPAPQSARGQTRNFREQALLDPQLDRRGPWDTSRSATSSLSYPIPANFHHALGPMQHPWGHGSYVSNSPSAIKQESISSPDDDDDDDDDVFEPKSSRASLHRSNNSVFAPSQLDDASELGDDRSADADSSKLKGIIWPGMAIFDSATPDMKRRRNQKKDAWVLRALQATSEYVEPTECVYDTSGALQVEREITGLPPSDDMLIDGESEPDRGEQEKKRPRRKARQPLVKKEPNTGRVSRGKVTAPLHTRTAPYYDGMYDEDDDLTYRPRPKKRTGLSIHRDNTGPEITFNQPAPMQYLTAGHNPLRSSHPNTSMRRSQMFENPLVPRSHTREASWGQAQIPFRPASTGQQQPYSTFGGMFAQPSSAANVNANHPFMNFNFGAGQVAMSHNPMQLYQSATGGDEWDMLNSITDPVDSVVGDADLGFGIGGDGAGNPLFLSDTKPVVDDDEGTISATSEH